MRETPRLMISAGEASGDHHAARVISALQAQGVSPVMSGMGGPYLAQRGMDILVDCRDVAVVGIIEVLRNWRFLNRQLESLRTHMRRHRPDLLILVDFPDFNLKLARTARELGIPVLFYVSPQVWAWRARRVHQIGHLVDMMAVLFPFETEIYERAGVPVRYVGHPLVDDIKPTMTPNDARAEFGLNREQAVLGLMPGSRHGEIERLLPILLDVARIVQQQRPEVQMILPVAQTLDPAPLRARIEDSGLKIHLVDGGRAYDVIQVCDAIVTASGTATLEIALMRKPMAVVYRVHWLTYLILRCMVRIRQISLANIVAGKEIVREFLQGNARPEPIARETLCLLEDDDYRNAILVELDRLRERMGEGGAPERTAKLVMEMLARDTSAGGSQP